MKSQKAIEFKGTNLALNVLKASLRSADPAALDKVLAKMAASSPDFFDFEPTVFDLAELGDAEVPDWERLIALLRRYRINPIAVSNVADAQRERALAAGLVIVSEAEMQARPPARAAVEPPPPPPPPPLQVVVPPKPVGTIIVDRPLRSGQQVYARGGDVVVLAMVNAGAEVIADGNIHVYATLRGRALAGASGNAEARILTTCLEAELVSIAGIYRTFESGVDKNLAGKPAQIRLAAEAGTGKQRLLVEPLAVK